MLGIVTVIFVFLHVLLPYAEGSFNETAYENVTLLQKYPGAKNNFGNAIAVSGDYIVVGGEKDVFFSQGGFAAVFNFNGSHWIELLKLTPVNRTANDKFGSAVAMDQTHIVIGDDGENNQAGAVYVYNRTGVSWQFLTKLFANDSSSSAFGTSVSIYGNYIVVGTTVQIVYVFKHSEGEWRKQQKIVSPIDNANFGLSVTIDTEYIVIAAYGGNAIYIYKLNGTVWVQKQKNTQSNGDFGSSVDIDGENIVVGRPNNAPGNLHVYRRNANDTWVEVSMFSAPNDAGKYGSSVAISNGYVVVSNHEEIIGGIKTGASYVYKFSNGTWKEHLKLVASNAKANDNFGVHVATDNGTVVVSNTFSDYTNATTNTTTKSTGSVYMFNMPRDTISEDAIADAATTDKSISLVCGVQNMTAFWKNSSFAVGTLNVNLLDGNCNTYHSNATMFWITTRFDTCGNIIEEHDNTLTIKNSAFVTITRLTSSPLITRGKSVYQYNIQCTYSRSKNITVPGYTPTSTNITQVISTTTVTGEFNITMDIYISSSFTIVSSYPIEVSTKEIIYIGVVKHGEDTSIKIVVEKCFATKNIQSIDPNPYIFFLKKCALDDTFKIKEFTDNKFNMEIQAFKFIEVNSAVYLHCEVLMCKSNSTAPRCQQVCLPTLRKRREVITVTEGTEKMVTSGKVTFTKKKLTCDDITCPLHSSCVYQYPAICRCDQGYVLTGDVCTSERVSDLENMHLNIAWKQSYSDTSSDEFIIFAYRMEKKLMTLLKDVLHIPDIEGVKITQAKQGSVVIDFSIVYSKNSSEAIVHEQLINRMKTKNNDAVTSAGFEELKIIRSRLPTIKNKRSNDGIKMTEIVVISVTVPFISSVVVLFVCMYKRYKRKAGD